MENLAERIAAYSCALKYEEIPSEVVHKAKALLIDTLGCALGAYGSEPAKIARRVAGRVFQCDMPATILGSDQQTTPELATFANGVMVRYLDFNDGFVGISRGGGHPSDCFAPILTCADAAHATGKEVILASVLAYEIFCRLSDQVSLFAKGLDYPVFGVIASAVGVSKIFGLSQRQTTEAINLATAPNISLRQTRVGEVSAWKGCAMANAARNAVFATLLAKEGMTGPSPIFEGRYGFFKILTGPFILDEFGGHGKPFRIMEATIKRYPCGQVGQTAIDAAIKLRSKIRDVSQIAQIEVGTFTEAKNVMAGDPEKWRPETRESADHSLPYVVAIALMYGSVEINHFGNDYLHNPDLLELVKKIKVDATDECNNLHPEASANRVTIITRSGEKMSELVQYHRGHYRNFLTDKEVEQKFHSLTRDLLPAIQGKELQSAIWNLEQVENVARLIRLLKIGTMR